MWCRFSSSLRAPATVLPTRCAITQLTCGSGAHSTSGSISGNQFTYTGESGAGDPATCTGTASANTISGTCTTDVGSCTFTGDRGLRGVVLPSREPRALPEMIDAFLRRLG